MLKAIHKQTGKLIPAFKLESDATWIGKEKEKWIAPYPEIDNWKFLKEKGINEVEVSFIKSYMKDDNVRVSSHFRIYTEGANPSPQNESEEHKLAKEGIYEDILDNKIKINGKGIKDLFNIEDIDFEYPLSKSRFSKIADVIVKFDKSDIQYGKGIIFEIQLSNQTAEQTEDRTFNRVIEGYSIVWLWDGMFNLNNKLKDKEVVVIPFLKAIDDYKQIKELEVYEQLNYYGSLIEVKKEEVIKEINLENNKITNIFKNISELKEKANSEISEKRNESIQNIKELSYLLNSNLKKEVKPLTDSIKEEVYKNIIEKLKNEEEYKLILKNSINYNYLSSSITNNEIKKLVEVLNININEKLKNLIDDEIKPKIGLLVNDSVKEMLNKAINSYSSIKMNIFSECEKCNGKFPVSSLMFEKGKGYCEKCFNELPTNWKKELEMWKEKIQSPSQRSDLKKWSS